MPNQLPALTAEVCLPAVVAVAMADALPPNVPNPIPPAKAGVLKVKLIAGPQQYYETTAVMTSGNAAIGTNTE
jgi:hypothetical protein